MNEDGIRFDTNGEDDARPRPLTVARTAVSDAADRLARVAEHLRAAELDDARGATRILEAEERALDAARALEESRHEVAEAQRRAEYAERLVAETQDLVREGEAQRAAAEELARMADERSRTAEDRARSAEERVAGAEERASDAEARAALAEGRGGGDAEVRIAEAVQRAEDAEERLEVEMARTVELSRRLDEASRTATTADERADEADERAHVSLERTKQLEAEIDELRAALDESWKAPPVTVIVDEARTALQEAVAAEVRRPLSSIMGLTLAIKHADPSTPEGLDMIRQLSMHARKLDRLVAEYLELDRLIDGTLRPNRRRTDLAALVRRVIEESPDLEGMEVRVDATKTGIAVNPRLAEQMVEALLANAGRRTPPGGTITVRVIEDASGATVVAEDGGERVPSFLRETLLDPAQQLRSGPPKGGTGLILMSRLAQIHRGRASVEDLPHGGAAFKVFLPAVAEDGPGASAHGSGGDDRSALEDGAIAI